MTTNNNDQETTPSIECRICHSKTTRDLILSPCLCKGLCLYQYVRIQYFVLECVQKASNKSLLESCLFSGLVASHLFRVESCFCYLFKKKVTKSMIYFDF